MHKQPTSNNAEIAELVNKHINNLDDKGKLQLPDDMPDLHKHIIRGEKRTRDAQAALSKSNNANIGLAAENLVLKASALTIVPDDFQLSEADLAELNEIKFKDPDAYRLRVNKLESDAQAFQAKKLEEETTKARDDANTSHVAKSRSTVLAEFRDANPDLIITDDVLVNDVPLRFMKGVTDGKYSYAEYLEKVKAYIDTGKSVKNGNESEQHNLNSMNGGLTPGKKAAENAGKNDYKKLTF